MKFIDECEEVDIISSGDTYSWAELRVYKNPDTGEVGYSHQTGCSCSDWDCNYFEELEIIENYQDREFLQKLIAEEFDPCDAVETMKLVDKAMKK